MNLRYAIGLGVAAISLFIWSFLGIGNPAASLWGTWALRTVDGKTITSVRLHFFRDGSYSQTSSGFITSGTYLVEKREERTILRTRFVGSNIPELTEAWSKAPESQALFKVEGKRLTIKETRTVKGQPNPRLPPATSFASEPGYWILELSR